MTFSRWHWRVYRFLTQLIMAVSLLCLTYVAAHASSGSSKRIYVMAKPNGKTVWLREGGRNGDINEEIDDITLPGLLSIDTRRELCGQPKKAKYDLDQTEMLLSLNLMIKDFSRLRKPRELTEAEAEALSQVPFCAPFTFELRVLSKLFQGWKLKEQRQARN